MTHVAYLKVVECKNDLSNDIKVANIKKEEHSDRKWISHSIVQNIPAVSYFANINFIQNLLTIYFLLLFFIDLSFIFSKYTYFCRHLYFYLNNVNLRLPACTFKIPVCFRKLRYEKLTVRENSIILFKKSTSVVRIPWSLYMLTLFS